MQEWRLLAPTDAVYTVSEVRQIAEAAQDLMTALPGTNVFVVIDGLRPASPRFDMTRSAPSGAGQKAAGESPT